MEVHAVRPSRRTRLTGCHLAPIPPLQHPVLHSFHLGTLPTWLHHPTAHRLCLRLLYPPPCILSPRVSPLRRLLVGLLRPRGDGCECLRDQLANVSLTPRCRLRGSLASRGFPPVSVQSLREQLADVPRAGRSRFLRRIRRLYPRCRSPHGGRVLRPMRRRRTTRYRHGPSRHHGRGPSRYGWIRRRGRLRWRSRCSRPRHGHRQGWLSSLRPRGPNGSRSPRRALGHAMHLPLRHPQLLDSWTWRRYWRGRRCRR